jgi:hypothetical protein
VAAGRLGSHEVDPGCPADDAAATVGADQVRRTQRIALGDEDIDAGVAP